MTILALGKFRGHFLLQLNVINGYEKEAGQVCLWKKGKKAQETEKPNLSLL